MPIPKTEIYVNSLGQRLARIPAGTFLMGMEGTLLPDALSGKTMRCAGDFDEYPVHEVTLSKPFYMGVCEVTNAEYEEFDATHRAFRGKLGISKADDEAVVFVSWHEALSFCAWLSEKEGLPYRLPTEAEWEYACRAGTTTPFHTGASLPEAYLKNARRSRFPDPKRSTDEDIVQLTVGQTPPNPWGLHDMHGNVEEWCQDWYGPYEAGRQTDPVGRAEGDFRVTRGGSHSTEVYYLRSSNRMGTLPEDKHWLIGFRLVLGEARDTEPLPPASPEAVFLDVRQEKPACEGASSTPVFRGPKPYVKIPADSYGPLFSGHNHDPALAACPNGDLLAVWYSAMNEEESDRELTLLGSRLRHGRDEWDDASVFWNAPDRNNHGPALGSDGEGTLYFFAGLSAAASWSNLAIIMRTSKDSGATWTRARLIVPEHGPGHVPAETVLRLRDGRMALAYDTRGGTGLLMTEDGGKNWHDPGGTIAGIHAGVVELADGRLYALGRGHDIDGRMPASLSEDGGKTWTYAAGPFPPIQGGQRLALMRLKEGPLFLASFANNYSLTVCDASGAGRPVAGLFGALSFDEGATWPVRRLISDDGPERRISTTSNRPPFIMDASHAEPLGYLAACQSTNGLIHVITSRNHYSFNQAWMKSPPPALRER